MPESLDTFSEIANIRLELEEHTHLLVALLRANPTIESEILKTLDLDPVLVEILLLTNGVRTQGEIQKSLADAGVKGSSVGSISNKFDVLYQDLSLISPVRQTAGKVYRLSPLADRLKLVRTLEKARAKANAATAKKGKKK